MNRFLNGISGYAIKIRRHRRPSQPFPGRVRPPQPEEVGNR